MHDIDSTIIFEIQDGKNISAIAKHHNVSIPTIRNHLKKLKDGKILVDKRYRIRYKLLGMQQVILGLEVRPEFLIDAIIAIKKINSVKELYRTSGDHVLVAVISGKGDEVAEDLQKIRNISGVSNIYPAFVEEIEK
ncbi:MAG: helix-turn-helix domain-containing protein [Candidatus Micrarchaeia archaeon]